MAKKTTHIVLGVHITGRQVNAAKVQELLTKYGCNIKTRLGLHNIDECSCSTNGLLLLHMSGEPSASHELAEKLSALSGVSVQKMVFEYENE